MGKRVIVEDGWAVKDEADGGQVRARLMIDHWAPEPERGKGMWNEGVTLYRVEDSYGGVDMDSYAPMENIMSIIENGEDRNTGEYREDSEWMRDKDQVARYLRIFHNAQFAEIMTHQDFRDTAHILVVAEGIEDGADPEVIARSTFEEWDYWAKGEAYVIEYQTRTLAEAMEDGEFWAAVSDYVGGYYGDEDAESGIAEILGAKNYDLPSIYGIMED